jgi:hypothetical protein
MLTVGSAASAATFATAVATNGKLIISLEGEIVEGDADSFNQVVQRADNGGREIMLVRLDSPGGRISEAADMAKTIRFKKMATAVSGTSKCASACFILFAAGTVKYVNSGASVGVHGASDEAGNETVRSNAATISMARLVKDLGVPPGIIGQMVVTPPDRMVWLTPADLSTMGTIMTDGPREALNVPTTTPLVAAPGTSQVNLQEDSTPSSFTGPSVPQAGKHYHEESHSSVGMSGSSD